MSNKAPNYIRVNGRVYKRAKVWQLSPEDKTVFERLMYEWLDGEGWRSLFTYDFGHWPAERLGDRMAEEFGAYLGSLAEEALPWKEYAMELKRAKNQKKER